MVKKIGFVVVLVLFIIAAFNYELIVYGIGQGRGQFKILWNAQPVEKLLTSNEVPDSLKQKIRLVEDIRQFAFDSLGLTRSENYTTIYDQKGKEILWVVTACEPYQFIPRIWSFPVIGSFTYKGFFDLEKAKKLASELKEEGNDVDIRSVSGWSTLGWFKDPILSNMLFDDDGELASTIIHELTHGTMFIPDSMTFNENLASFIGNQGAIKFLSSTNGNDASAVIEFKERRVDSKKFTDHMIRSADMLEALYSTIAPLGAVEKETRKVAFINEIVENLDTVGFHNPVRYQRIFEQYHPNNAYFISFLNYRERQADFQVMLTDDFNDDLVMFINFWKEKYKI